MPQIPTQTGVAGAGPAGPPGGAIAFESLAEIAAGDTARVDLCRLLPPHPRAGSLVAVKRLHPHIAEDPTFAKQFFDEVWMTASLRHANVVEVAGWGSDVQGAYLAVELVQGVSLLRLMKTIFETGEAFTERMVVYIALRVCLGLAAAHSLRAPTGELLGLVHRDLTPGNILCSFNGEVKIADFGMAKAKQRLTKTLTGMRKGEPTYMAPEQARSDDIDARADLFSLGVMLFELFAGRRPWIARSDLEMIQAVGSNPPADLRDLRPKIDRELVSIVNHCLEKSPTARFQSARDIASRLDEWLTLHGYQEGNDEALGRFVRRNAMRQMRWFERAIAGDMTPDKVGRDIPPRIPNYNDDNTEPFPPAAAAAPAAPAVRGAPSVPPAPVARAAERAAIEDHPTIDASRRGGAAATAIARLRTEPSGRGRPGAAPADPRSIRAAQAVQQLKKLAPPVEPPRGRGRPRTSMDDDDGDPTDVSVRPRGVGRDRGSHPDLPRISGDDDEEETEDATSEEAPTLVQKGDAKLQALRAAARREREAARQIDDDDSDDRVTEVKREEHARAVRAAVAAIADPESELPTTPMKATRPNIPASPQIPGPMKGKKPDPGPRSPVHQIIPRSPDIPQRPFPGAPPARGRSGAPPAVPEPPRPRPPDPEPTPVSVVTDPARITNSDEVLVIDRNALHKSLFATEEALVAEADRLAIEAVRRTEEARAAQLRAERKTAAAKLASEAAMIATEAVRMIRAEGLPAAVKRLEEARTLEQNLQTGKIPLPDPADLKAGAGRGTPSSFPGPASPTMASARAAVLPPVDPALPSFPGGPPSTTTPVFTPLAYGPGAQAPPGAATTPLPSTAPPPPPPPPPQPAPGPRQPPPALRPATPAQIMEAEALRPQGLILGLPGAVVVALAIAGVIIVILLALLLAR
jgi:eukaryotic-like serine/threonine-protein kinase